MTRIITIKILQTTRANLNTAAGSSGLLPGEPYLITDEGRIAIATAVDDYEDFPLTSEVISALSDDTTPQLGGKLDINGKPFVETLTAGESLVAGNICYLKSDGKYWKTDCDAEATTKGRLALANATISADNTGEFIVRGRFTTTGLTQGSVYYISATAGAFTATAPSSGQYLRVLGHAESTTSLIFEPSQTWILVP